MNDDISNYGTPFTERFNTEEKEYHRELRKRADRQYHEIDADGLNKIHPLRSAEVWDGLMGNPRF